MTGFIDSHVNLHHERFADDRDAVIADARRAGVLGMLTICDKMSSIAEIAAIADGAPDIWRSVGAHPHYASDHQALTTAALIEACAPEKVIGVGECGLDFHYEHSPRDIQARLLDIHIEAAQETGLPLILHTRDADDAMRETLSRAYERRAFAPLLHCYTGGPGLADAVLEIGGYISFSGILTFKNADDVRAVAARAPLDRLLIETDCPYLAPVPMRGRRAEPAHVALVAEKLAEIKDLSTDEIASATTANFFSLFSRAKKPR